MAVSFLQTAVTGTNSTTFTFSSQNLGTASVGRYIVAAIYGDTGTTGRTCNSVTIGGVSATISVQRRPTSRSTVTAIAIANVTTGATGDVVITFSGSMSNCGIGLYHLTDIISATAHNTNSDASSTAETLSTTVNIPADGYAFAVMGSSTTGTETNTWTGMNEDFDTDAESGNPFSGASLNPSTQQTGLSVSCTVTGITSGGSLCVASFEASTPPFIPTTSFFT